MDKSEVVDELFQKQGYSAKIKSLTSTPDDVFANFDE